MLVQRTDRHRDKDEPELDEHKPTERRLSPLGSQKIVESDPTRPEIECPRDREHRDADPFNPTKTTAELVDERGSQRVVTAPEDGITATTNVSMPPIHVMAASTWSQTEARYRARIRCESSGVDP